MVLNPFSAVAHQVCVDSGTLCSEITLFQKFWKGFTESVFSLGYRGREKEEFQSLVLPPRSQLFGRVGTRARFLLQDCAACFKLGQVVCQE